MQRWSSRQSGALRKRLVAYPAITIQVAAYNEESSKRTLSMGAPA